MDHSDAALTVLTHIPNLPAPSAVTQKVATPHHHTKTCSGTVWAVSQRWKVGEGGGRDGLGVLANDKV